MHLHIYHHWDDEPEWVGAFLARIDLILEQQEMIMSTLDDLKAAQAVTDTKIAAVKADVETLLAKLAAIPTGGLDHVQQAALDDAVAHASAINDQLSGIDTEANPPAA